MACGNQTVFNQFTLTCTSADEAIPCGSSPDFFYLNQRIGEEKAQIHGDDDLVKLSVLFSKN